MSHSKRSFASAIDVELRIISPVFLVVGSHTIRIGSLQPDDVTKSAQGVVFKVSMELSSVWNSWLIVYNEDKHLNESFYLVRSN